MHRSELTIDLAALRHNVRALLRSLAGSELWAVVKADGYGHGALEAGKAALETGATVLCVATVAEALPLRAAVPHARLLVLGPAQDGDVSEAREARLELVVPDGAVPDGVPVHLKLDTGMGRWGLGELPEPPARVVGLMSHLASADCDPAFTALQTERFRKATAPYAHLTRHLANSAGILRHPDARFDAGRAGIALYGLSPFGEDPAADGLRPVLAWRSYVAQVKLLAPGESTGYGRRFVARQPTRIGIVPVGYADGFRRALSGTAVLVEGERAEVLGTISMDAFAVRLPEGAACGSPVTMIGDGLGAEEHARVAGTINYELVTGIVSSASRARRVVVGA